MNIPPAAILFVSGYFKHTFLLTKSLIWIIVSVLISCKNPESHITFSHAVDTLTETSFLKIDTLNSIPNELKPLINGKVKNVFKVDFDGDGKQDFICDFEPLKKIKNADFLETWITSYLKVVKQQKKYSMDYDYNWFINIDEDIEPEIFSATGYEDGIDYACYDQDLKTGKDKLLFYFNPVIIENNKFYWGYAWDIKGILLKTDKANIYLKTSIDHDIIRDENITIPNSKKKFPAIFFYGHSTQPDGKIETIRNIKWTALNELK